jgi:hypothetical protein
MTSRITIPMKKMISRSQNFRKFLETFQPCFDGLCDFDIQRFLAVYKDSVTHFGDFGDLVLGEVDPQTPIQMRKSKKIW